MKDILILKVVFDFLSDLSAGQIEDLINKRACLKIVSLEKGTGHLLLSNEHEIQEILDCLEKKDTREDALTYLRSLELTKPVLKALVKHYNIPLASKATNVQMTDAVVEAVVGAKLRYDALYNTNLTK